MTRKAALMVPLLGIPAAALAVMASRAFLNRNPRFATQASFASSALTNNPLLSSAPFPLFDQVRPEHVVPAIRHVLSETLTSIEELEARLQADPNPTWATLVEPLERISDHSRLAWEVVKHLEAVKNSDELRAAVEEVQPETVRVSLKLVQSQPIYKAYRALRDGPNWNNLDEAQKRIVEMELRDFSLGGVALEGETKARFNAIQEELVQLSTKFTNNVLDSTKAFKKLVTDKADVDGLPETALALAAQRAASDGHKDANAATGPWLLTLDFPCYQPVMLHAKSAALREELYKAYVSRASAAPTDNTPLMERILALRQEKAALLGFANYAELSMASKMATLPKAEALLEEVRTASFKHAEQDQIDIEKFAAENGFPEVDASTGRAKLQWWDVSFWADRLRESRYSISDEELRPYLALPNVLDGLFNLAKRLFDIEVVAADGEAPVWDPSVRFFRVKRNGETVAFFYFDPYSRMAEKRGGAWMDVVLGRSTTLARPGEKVRLPVAHMVCNQTPPIGSKPSLMTLDEVTTLFHEFGHALQHMLTHVNYLSASGINGVDWDAVELPSQFMENWCYDENTLKSFAKHYETGEPLPKELFQRVLAAKTYRAGSMYLRQIRFGSTDLELHARYKPVSGTEGKEEGEGKGQGEGVFAVDQAMAVKTLVTPPYPGDRFLCSFNHIFAGGYAAGYYSYLWAEVLSADSFAAFEEAGLDKEDKIRETGHRFRDTVLALGGGVAPAEVFKRFRGREPSPQALLRHNNLLVDPAAV
nr:ATP-dependent clp protease ATP-binding subunit clpa-like protein (clpA) [Polytomella parva]|eukprot:CAMPEP_0175083350 /NCGR_PEP_ID=MMETSP0052_2-20121109/27328_1 /TAXON_ID=51329 ORGANISM="Polytomella parva, Strain SAG 63-3" /NCGR_SAMPLE_ID=MMETSP0052_2 /ASSEMBLY_ACC=CAM_ASM_000194 /LENGTH=763 /DNA_ID=CAMNT_0016354779 /DNA_START=266 /DNA_END=2557 /DNA_ORIENTATION=+